MIKFLISALILLTTANCSFGYRRVCYYTNWSQYRNGIGKFYPENVDPTLCTHIVYAFAKMNGNQLAPYEWNDESTPWMEGMYARFNKVKSKNPLVKTLLSVGGWNMASAPFTSMVATDAGIHEFAQSVIKFVRAHNFDGFDLDWEWPAGRGSPPGDRDRFTLLLKVLQEEFVKEAQTTGKDKLILGAAVNIGKSHADKGYDIPQISKYLDQISLMTYDLHGPFDSVTGHNSPLKPHPSETGDQRTLNLEWVVDYWLSHGAPADKLNLGIPVYGHTFRLANPSNNGLGAKAVGNGGQAGRYTSQNGFLSYYEICEILKNGGIRHYTPEMYVPYIVNGNEWITYDDQDSIRQKVDYAKQRHLGGVMIWSLDLDDFNGVCGQGKYPLIHTIVNELNKPGSGNILPVVTTSKPVATTPHRQTTILNHQTVVPPRTTIPPLTASTPQHHHIGATNRFDCTGKASGFYADPTSCSQYFICAGTLSFEVKCAAGLQFNDVTKYCDYPAYVKCNLQPQSHTTYVPATVAATTHAPITLPPQFLTIQVTPQTPLPTIRTTLPTKATVRPSSFNPNVGIQANSFCQMKNDGLYRDASNCGHFIQCNLGYGFVEPCPPGLVFNEANNQCDYITNVPACVNYQYGG